MIVSNDEAEVKKGMWSVVTFLERAECVFDAAILATPTGEMRNKFCDLNIERMSLIQHSEDITSYAKKLRALLGLLAVNEDVRDEMSCDDTRFGDATDNRNQLVKELVAMIKT